MNDTRVIPARYPEVDPGSRRARGGLRLPGSRSGPSRPEVGPRYGQVASGPEGHARGREGATP
jgi:hypothetical protein